MAFCFPSFLVLSLGVHGICSMYSCATDVLLIHFIINKNAVNNKYLL